MRAIEFDKGNSDHDEERKINPNEQEESVVSRFRSRLYAESIAKGKSTAGALQKFREHKRGRKGNEPVYWRRAAQKSEQERHRIGE
jgi:hypothetical protein